MLFGVLCLDHVGSSCLALPPKPKIPCYHSAVEAERHPSVTYNFQLLLGNQNVGINPPHISLNFNWIRVTEFSFFEKGILFVFVAGLSKLRFVSFAVLVNKSLLLRCKDFSGFFKFIVLECFKWIFLLTLSIVVYCAENWKLLLVRICFCTFLFVDKIVYGLLAIGDACFSFFNKSVQIFSIKKLARRMFVFFTIFEILVKFKILKVFLVVLL